MGLRKSLGRRVNPGTEASFGGQVSRNPIGGEEPLEHVVAETRVQHRIPVDEVEPPRLRGCRAQPARLRHVECGPPQLLGVSICPHEPLFVGGLQHERAGHVAGRGQCGRGSDP